MVNVRTILASICPAFLRGYVSRIEASPYGHRLARGMFWSMAGTVLSRGLSLASSVIVARMMGKVAFGELGIIQSTMGMFGVFAGLGLGSTAIKYVAEFREKDPAKAGRIIALSTWVSVISGGLMAGAMLIVAPWLAAHTLAAPHLARLLQVSVLSLFFGAIIGAQNGALAGFEAFKTIAKINLWAGIITFPLVVAGAILAGLDGVVWGGVLSMVINWIFNHLALKREAIRAGVTITLAGYRNECHVLRSYSLPALLAGVVVVPVTWACNAILVNRANGYMEMGIFNAANQWFSALMFLPGILAQVVLPMLSERLGYDDKVRSNRIFIASIKLNAVVVLPAVLIGCLASPIIMSLYGTGFREAWPTLIIVLFTAGLLAIQSPAGSVIQASNRMWLGFVMNLGWGLAFLIGTWLLASYGSIGIASARAVAYLAHACWTLAFVSITIRSKSTSTNKTPMGLAHAHFKEDNP